MEGPPSSPWTLCGGRETPAEAVQAGGQQPGPDRTEWAIQEASWTQQRQRLMTSCWTREARGPGCGLNTGMRPGGRDPGNRTHLVEVAGRSRPPSSSTCRPLKGSSVPFPLDEHRGHPGLSKVLPHEELTAPPPALGICTSQGPVHRVQSCALMGN